MSKKLTLGIIGSGQLGSMLCNAAKKLNIKTVVISDDKDGPAQNFCNEFIFSKYDNLEKIDEFISKVDVVTFEFENIPVEILREINKKKEVIPRPDINKVIQNRELEKTFLNNLGIKTTIWSSIKFASDIQKNKELLPAILKTNTLGYDGHGQFIIESSLDIDKNLAFPKDYILEKKVDLKKEISVVITRFKNGEYFTYEPIENIHKDQILKNSKIPAEIDPKISKQAKLNAKIIAEKLDYVGTMCVEYFIDKDDNLLANEIVPRVHNLGHLTINAFNISQFENHIRAVCGLKKEEVKKIANAEMNNILEMKLMNTEVNLLTLTNIFLIMEKKILRIKGKWVI